MDYDKIYSTPFEFNCMTLTLNDVKKWEIVKRYTESSHLDRFLLKDTQGNLFLYEFYEYVDFGGGNDLIYQTYTVVKDEQDADELNKNRYIQRSPFFRIMPNYEIIIG